MITVLKDVLHVLFGHEWGEWQTFLRSRDADFGVPITYQWRVCQKCGKEKQRCEIG